VFLCSSIILLDFRLSIDDIKRALSSAFCHAESHDSWTRASEGKEADEDAEEASHGVTASVSTVFRVVPVALFDPDGSHTKAESVI